MQKLKFFFALILLGSALFFACNKDDVPGKEKMADVVFAGRIIDENGSAVQGALVKAGSEVATTDVNGVFRLPKVNVIASHALVSVSKNGYFDISRPYIVEDEALQTITIQLLEKVQVGSVTATAGGAVNVPGGVKLTFPANAVTDENGNAYSGTVRVFAKYLDPSDPNLALTVPGDMTAETATEEVFLATYGMVGVEIESQAGQKLKIASGKEVELRMPIIASQQASAPSTIPLWHYAIEHGHWEQEGLAQKVGNEYVGNVAHFSFWNCDQQLPLTQLHGQIFIENNSQPLRNAVVRITLIATNSSAFGYTDNDGKFGGCVPKDEALRLEVMSPENCAGQVYYTQDIGPFSAETTLPPINLQLSAQTPLLQISGQLLSCSGQAVTNGYVTVTLDNSKFPIFADANGQFNMSMILCSNVAQTAELVGYDLDNLLESATSIVPIPPNTNFIHVTTLTVCNALTEFIEYSLDGGAVKTVVDPYGGLDGDLVYLASQDSTVANYLRMQFLDAGQLGTFPVHFIDVNLLSDYNAGATLSTTVTEFGNVGGFITGTFGGTFVSTGGTHTLSGNYRVKRDY